jgi:hypothetical protein
VTVHLGVLLLLRLLVHPLLGQQPLGRETNFL